MLGTICFRLCNCISPLHSYRSQTIIHNHVASTNAYRLGSNRGLSLKKFSLSLKRSCIYHTNSCTQSTDTCFATIIQHQPLISDKNDLISDQYDSRSSNLKDNGGSHTSSFIHFLELGFPKAFYYKSIGRSNIASCLIDGSWNVAWDSRPARWLHGQHSAWLSFGVCTCYSSFHIELSPENKVTEEIKPPLIELDQVPEISRKAAQGKQALENYEVISACSIFSGKMPNYLP